MTNSFLIIIGIIYFVMSIITFLLYAQDKKAAQSRKWRIPGRTLHLLELLGGWPGALAAQSLLRHKTSWRSEFAFKLTTWLIVIIHVAFWLWWIASGR